MAPAAKGGRFVPAQGKQRPDDGNDMSAASPPGKRPEPPQPPQATAPDQVHEDGLDVVGGGVPHRYALRPNGLSNLGQEGVADLAGRFLGREFVLRPVGFNVTCFYSGRQAETAGQPGDVPGVCPRRGTA